MTLDEAHELAGRHGLVLRFDNDGKSWQLGSGARQDGDSSVWIAPHVFEELTPRHFVRHYVEVVLARIADGEAEDEES